MATQNTGLVGVSGSNIPPGRKRYLGKHSICTIGTGARSDVVVVVPPRSRARISPRHINIAYAHPHWIITRTGNVGAKVLVNDNVVNSGQILSHRDSIQIEGVEFHLIFDNQ